MQTYHVIVENNIAESFRVQQLKSIFDLNLIQKLKHEWNINLPLESIDWQVGLIVGPSGSGKSTVANHIFKDKIHSHFEWPKNKAIIDGFPQDVKIQDITNALNSVGFSSPPSWLKPFHVLSNGEKFRAELARCVVEYCKDDSIFVFDEFTSVVDRTVAKIGSCAVAKAIRRGKGKMIVVSCHYDIAEWLGPDWILDMKDESFKQVSLRRPAIELSFYETKRENWQMFKNHHYLSGNLNKAAKTFGCFYDGQMIGFAAVLPQMGIKGCRRVHRVVVMPDFQGVGIGKAFLKFLGEYYTGQKQRLRICSSHPAIMRGLERDKNWKCTNFYKTGCGKYSPSAKSANKTLRRGVATISFEYIGG